MDVDPKLRILWINENLPKEYIDSNDLVKGYDALSKADIFLGRTARRQNYALWSYACDIMNGGIATAKTHNYPNDSYSFPTWLREKKNVKVNSDVRDLIIEKISNVSHNSSKKSKVFLLTYFTNMFRNDTYFAIKMKNKFDFSESEIKYLLGESHKFKLKEILLSREPIYIKKTQSEIDNSNEEEKEEVQQSLFDF